jgi:hypothetical protein
MASLNTMVKSCSGLIDTKDVTDWENDFLTQIAERTQDGDNTTSLTERQIGVLERIYKKHFAG